jgi:DNA polymerase-3 subunit alpha
MNESDDSAPRKGRAAAGHLRHATTCSSRSRTTASPQQHRTNPQLIEIAKRLIGRRCWPPTTRHYVTRDDAEAHDALLCVQTGSLMSDPKRFKFNGHRALPEVRPRDAHLFREVEVACDNTLWIAERCDVEIEFGEPQLPNFPLPEGFDDDAEYLRAPHLRGRHMRWGAILAPSVVERIEYELQDQDMGFARTSSSPGT